MKINIKALVATLLVAAMGLTNCKKPEYSFGQLKTPSSLTLTTAIAGATTAAPTGAGTGNVTITAQAADAITYKIDFGDGTTQMIPSGTIIHKYNSPGTFDYTIVVTAIGTGGTTSNLSKKISVFVAYTIPDYIVQALTGSTSKTWVTDNLTPGHVGVGPADTFGPDYYAAGPNERAACQYDDLMVFSKDASGNINLSVDNKGQSFMIGAATGFYGASGGDGCYVIDLSAPRKLAFMDATSASTTANSTRVQFMVPGNGLINFGTGGTTYEILSITANTIFLRCISIDGLAWYQKLKVKP